MKEFQIEQEIEINAPAAVIFKHMTNDVSAWWNHGFSKEPKAITLEPKVGGRFFEEFGEASGDGALYATVTHIVKGKKLILQGPMGMQGATFCNIRFELESSGDSTLLKLSHHTIGDVDDDVKADYARGWVELLQGRLKKLVEDGSI